MQRWLETTIIFELCFCNFISCFFHNEMKFQSQRDVINEKNSAKEKNKKEKKVCFFLPEVVFCWLGLLSSFFCFYIFFCSHDFSTQKMFLFGTNFLFEFGFSLFKEAEIFLLLIKSREKLCLFGKKVIFSSDTFVKQRIYLTSLGWSLGCMRRR